VPAAVIRRDDQCGAVAVSVHVLDLFPEPLEVVIEYENIVEIAIVAVPCAQSSVSPNAM